MTRRQFMAALLAASSIGITGTGLAETPRHKVGRRACRFVPGEPYPWRGAQMRALSGAIWHPASPDAVEEPQWSGPPGVNLFTAGNAAVDAPLLPGAERLPSIVLSHGTGGTAFDLGWLASALASRGYIVTAISHPGNTAVEPYTVDGFSLWWLRARDLGVVIDHMLADPVFGPRIDRDRIGAAGFSLGGYTMMVVAGALSDPAVFRRFCTSPEADGMCTSPPEFPDLPAGVEARLRGDPDYAALYQTAGASYRDPRVRAVFAIAPAIGPAVTAESLRQITIPVAIVAGADDTIVPPKSSAAYYAASIPGAQLTLLPGGVGHYTFLGSCSPEAAAERPMLCHDAPGLDRTAVHEQTIELASTFFAAHLRGGA